MSGSETVLSAHCAHCKIQHVGICGALTPEELARLNEMALPRTYKPGQIVRLEGEPVSFYGNVISGVAKMIKSISDGRQQIVELLLASDFLDQVYAKEAHCTIEAVTDLELCTYPKKPFEAMIQSDRDLEHRLFTMTLCELDSAQDWMLMLGRGTAQEKVASFLLMLTRRNYLMACPYLSMGETTDPRSITPRIQSKFSVAAEPFDVDQKHRAEMTIPIPVTRGDIADFLGLTMETVCRQMTLLKKDGVISLQDNHSFTVADLAVLSRLSGQEPSCDI